MVADKCQIVILGTRPVRTVQERDAVASFGQFVFRKSVAQFPNGRNFYEINCWIYVKYLKEKLCVLCVEIPIKSETVSVRALNR